MRLPDFLQKHRKKAEKLLARVGHTEFSGGTYQVQVSDESEPEDAWAFLQLGCDGTLTDGFCSCTQSEDASQCVHLAAAFLYVYAGDGQPLHERFALSFWQSLCRLFAFKLGCQPDLFIKKGKSLIIAPHFTVTAKTKAGETLLQEWIYHREIETEETSLKFNNLPQEEIEQWRQGRPSLALQYELSYWRDFAIWMLSQQDIGTAYTVQFDPKDVLPTHLSLRFPDLQFEFDLEQGDWPALISPLATIKAPLKVHTVEENNIERMIFDESRGHLEIVRTNGRSKVPREGTVIGDWMFVAGKGFYPQQEHSLLEQPFLEGEDLAQALEIYPDLIADKLEKQTLDATPNTLHYNLYFDDEWNLHINAYLKTPGDLDNAAAYGRWLHIPKKGFRKVRNLRFDQVRTVISADHVGEFVQGHRSWMNLFPGFATHLASIEGHLTYTLSEDHHLSFSRHVALTEGEERSHDFGAWVYLEGQGFYSKVGTVTGLPLQPGINLTHHQIAPFIRSQREDLNLIPNFFSERSPIQSVGLAIKLTEDERIWVQPHIERHEDYEDAQLIFFEDFVYTPGEGFYHLPPNKQIPDHYQKPFYLDPDEIHCFFAEELPNLRKTYSIIIDPRLHLPENLHLILHSVKEKTRGNYTLKLDYKARSFEIPIPDLWDAIQEKRRFFFHHAGILDLKHPRYDWIRHLAKNRIDRRGNTVTLSAIELIKLNIFDPITVEDKSKEAEELLETLMHLKIPEEPDTTGHKSTLRPYQTAGLKWLWFLYTHNLSGLLCDEMGLGKTHQAMALMAAIKNQNPDATFIVICPTSVIYHWEDKLNEFLPNFTVQTYYGTNRSLKKRHDVLLTSYGIWRMDHTALKKQSFTLAILDEIQMAKNESSRLHSTLLQLKAEMRLGLTGTPIENYLRELKALFDLTLPNYMPGSTLFKELFITPIEKENDPKATLFLQKLIDPFILRRKKADVLKELPPKTEEVYHCALLPEQQQLYKEVISRSREQLLRDLRGSSQISYMHIFAILSALKQICDHPAVYLKQPQKYTQHRSGKWDLFIELLNEARDSNQKVVVYSQYLAMLDIIELYLKESNIGYAAIRGSTTNRGEEIKRFNSDPNCEVFVGSLQASGLGIDLTAASVVIHYDRWWNAARENQATDRVHRIGQQRGVQVFKLVTKNTFEERIDQLIQSKAKLMESIVTADDQNVVKYLSREELIELLSDSFDSLGGDDID